MEKKNEKEMTTLLYRMNRYRAMGNGVMCQILAGKLRKLQASF